MTSLKPRVLFLCLAAVTLLTASASSQETIRWKFTKGQKLAYEMNQKMDMSTAVAGQAIDMKMTNIMDMDWVVQKINSDGSAEITQKISRVRFTMSGGPFGKVEFDSDKKDGGDGGPIGAQLAKSFSGLVNAEMTVTMTPAGEIKKLTLSDEAKAALKKASAQGGPGGGGVSEDTFRQMSTQMGAFFPAKAISKGDSWNKKYSVDNPAGKMEIDTAFKYLGTESKGGSRLAKIELKPKMSLTPKAGSPLKMEIKDKGSSGTSYFDLSKGILSSSSVTQNMNMEMSANGMQITMTMKAVTDMKLKK